MVAVVAYILAWGIHNWRRRLADDRDQFYSHEEMAQYQAFLKEVALGQVRDAEQKAAVAVGDREHWVAEADTWRAKAAASARAEAEYRWRAELKQQLSRGGW